jgi:hypothetical protein
LFSISSLITLSVADINPISPSIRQITFQRNYFTNNSGDGGNGESITQEAEEPEEAILNLNFLVIAVIVTFDQDKKI